MCKHVYESLISIGKSVKLSSPAYLNVPFFIPLKEPRTKMNPDSGQYWIKPWNYITLHYITLHVMSCHVI